MLRAKIKEYRNKSNLSQWDVARLIGKKDTYISAIERETVSLSVERFVFIAKALKVDNSEIKNTVIRILGL